MEERPTLVYTGPTLNMAYWFTGQRLYRQINDLKPVVLRTVRMGTSKIFVINKMFKADLKSLADMWVESFGNEGLSGPLSQILVKPRGEVTV